MSKLERSAWILMERIFPPISKGYIVRPDGPEIPPIVDMISELGVFGVIIGYIIHSFNLGTANSGTTFLLNIPPGLGTRMASRTTDRSVICCARSCRRRTRAEWLPAWAPWTVHISSIEDHRTSKRLPHLKCNVQCLSPVCGNVCFTKNIYIYFINVLL